MMTSPSNRRLFVPLSAEPFEWFLSGDKRWEVRRNRGAFHADRLNLGRRVELRRGYTGRSLWGTLAEVVVAPDARDLFNHVGFHAAIPTASSSSEAVAYVDKLLGNDQELVAFRIDVDDESSVQEIAFDPTLLELIDAGKKTTTVRAGHRDYQPGPAVFHFGSEVDRNGAIIQTRLTSLGELTADDAAREGYRTSDELVEVLRSYYPNLPDAAQVTVVEFKCQQG